MQPSNADVTVVVTCFNYGEFLAEAVDSALQQDGGPPAVIVVDDGSTDPATIRALEQLPPAVRLIRQENRGLSAARNAGLELVKTPYVFVLDADDRLMPGALSALRAPLDSAPTSAPAAAGGTRLGFTYGRLRFFGDWNGEVPWRGYDPFKLLYRHLIGSTCLMRREVYLDVGGFDPEFRAFEDWDFWLSALERGWYGLQIPELTFEYRRHGGSMLVGARRDYHKLYRKLRAKHRDLYSRDRDLAAQSDLGTVGRAFYRYYWAWRPVPGVIERALRGMFRSRG
jgi:glycosyltransferase involved in cell wall biosynthesis